MRQVAHALSLFLIILMSAWIIGCSGSDVLDETHDRYQISIVPSGGEGDGVYDLEVFSDPDCDGDPTTDDGEPGLAGISGDITIESATDAPYLQIQYYQVQYISQQSPLVAGGTALPPTLTPSEVLEHTINIQSGDEKDSILPSILTIDNKLNYVAQGGLVNFAHGIYVIRITLYGEDENNGDFEQTVNITVRLMDIDNC